MNYKKEEIIAAIKDNKITPHYQIIKNISNENEKKYEVLARLELNEGEYLSPYFFINLSKEKNVYDQVTKNIINKSFDYIKSLNEPDIKFSINIQVEDIQSTKTCDFLEKKLKETNLYKNLIIELSEENSLTGDQKDSTLKFIKKFKGFGIEFALDDFGTGYSTFDPLLNFDFDYIKLDRILIEDIHLDPKKFYTTDMICEFSKRTKLKVIAEFVEKEEIKLALEALDINYLQGYYYGEPELKIT